MLARNYDIKFNINEKNFFMLARKKKRKGISVGRLMRNYYKKPWIWKSYGKKKFRRRFYKKWKKKKSSIVIGEKKKETFFELDDDIVNSNIMSVYASCVWRWEKENANILGALREEERRKKRKKVY